MTEIIMAYLVQSVLKSQQTVQTFCTGLFKTVVDVEYMLLVLVATVGCQ